MISDARNEGRSDNWAVVTSIAAAGGLALAAWNFSRQSRRNSRVIKPGEKIVILGGGFAGVEAAQQLARELPLACDTEIVLIDKNDFLLFTPMLTEVAGGVIDPRHIVHSLRELPDQIHFVQGQVSNVDIESKTITIQRGGNVADLSTIEERITATQLVFALGSGSNYHGIEGVEENSYGVKSIQDAAMIANRVLELLERADAEPDPDSRKKYLTFVVAGGGYTGIETLAAINDLARDNIKYYKNLSPEDIRCVVAFAEERILNELTADLAEYATKKLQDRGVEFWPKVSVAAADKHFVLFDNGATIDSYLLVWAAGVKPSHVLESVDAQKGNTGALKVDACSRVAGLQGVWAVGDCAETPQPGSGKPYPPTAQDATRAGVSVANNIIAELSGEELRPFEYTPIGELALVGKNDGVARVYGINFSGMIAWAMWRAIYLLKMPGLRKKLHIGLDWLLDAVFGLDTVTVSGH